jgi:hypothetical protein
VYAPFYNGDPQQSYNEDAIEGKWYSTRPIAGGATQGNLQSLQAIAAANPDAKITAISFDNGGSSSGTTPVDAFSAGVDNALIGFGTAPFTRYDFGG